MKSTKWLHRLTAVARRGAVLAGTLVLVACKGGDAPLSGRWTFSMEPDFRGNRSTVECNIQQQSTSVTVKCGDGIEMRGAVEARSVTFSTPPMTDDRLVATYSATVNEEGTRLHGRWKLTGGVLNEEGGFTATRRE